MATEIELAIMAGRAYQSTRDDINKFPVPDGWQEPLDERKILPSGFEAGYFQRGNEIVISFAGTNSSSLVDPDWIANLDLTTSLVCAQQLREAAAYYLAVKEANKDNPDVTISFTGHSLGGGLAALLGVFFDEKAVTFDQAPFANSTKESIRNELVTYLNGLYSPEELATLAPELFFFINSDFTTRTENVSGFYVKGEVLSSSLVLKPFSTIGDQKSLTQGAAPDNLAFQISLHSQTLLTAFLQNDAFLQVTDKLPDMVKMLFDERLFAHDPSKLVDVQRNFLEGLIQHQTGASGDNMLGRFTADMQLIAQDGGLSLTNNNITKALTAFAMQKYDNELETGAGAGTQLFSSGDGLAGGIRFDMSNVAAVLADAKGFTGTDMDKMFTAYLNSLPLGGTTNVLKQQLPNLLDWYIQAGTQAMEATAGTQRAFMLGGNGNDILTGGNQADVLVGNGGQDTLNGGDGDDVLMAGWNNESKTDNTGDIFNGGTGDDLMIGGDGVDIYYIDGNDTIRDKGQNFIYAKDASGKYQLLAGGFVRDEGTNTYRFLSDSNITLTFNSPGHLVLNGTDSGTFENQTSAADFENGDFGIRLFDSGDAALTFNGTLANNTMAVSLNSANQPEYLYFSKYDNDPYPQYVSYDAYFSQNFHIDGNDGNDLLCGLAGRDYISGGTGSDRIFGDAWLVGLDWTNQGAGDVLYGNEGSDYISGGWGDDLISGGDDGDFLLGDSGNDIVAGDGGDDLVLGGTGNDQLLGGAGNDILFGDGYILGLGASMGDVPLPSTLGFHMTYREEGFPIDYSFTYQLGDASVEYGDDLLAGGDGNDWLNGGGGNDTLLGEAGNDRLDGGDGNDYLDGGDGNDLLAGQEGNDTLYGGAEADQLQGGLGDDVLNGGAGNDILFGDAGNDIIDGGAGDDYLAGGDGDDVYYFGRGSGHDTIFDSGSVIGDTVRLSDVSPENVSLVRYQDHLVLSLSDGSDTLTLANWFTSDATKVERFEFADGTVWGVAAIIGKLTSSNLSPEVSDPGNPLPWVLDASGTGVWVDNTVLIDLPIAYQGTWVNSLPSLGKITIDAYTGYWLRVQSTGSPSSQVPENKYIYGSAYNDSLYGGDGNDTLYGEEGNDYLVGGKGNDVLQGGPGIDIMIGGAGQDKYWVDDPNDVVIEYTANNWDWVYASCNYTLSANLSYLILQGNAREGRGNNQDNEIDANSLGNTLFGYGGNDSLIGGLGDDALYGGDGDDDLYGWRGNDLLDGGSGDDFLQDSYGNSIMRGGAGNDHLVYENGDGWEVNVLEGGEGNDILEAYTGSNTLVGGTGDDKLQCWSQYGNNRYLFNRGDGHDTLDIAGYRLSFGSNTLVFAAGITPQDIECSWNRVVTYRWKSVWPGGDFDGYYVIDQICQDLELTIKDTGDRVTVSSWFDNQRAQQLQIQFADGTVWDAAWLHQNTPITGTDQDDRYFGQEEGDFSLNGSAYNDVLDGRGGNDELFGFSGNDTLSGGTGNDYLYGDMGNDILDGGAGNDELCDDDGNDVYVFGRGYGQDIVYSWDEDLSFTDVVRFQPDVTPTDVVVSPATDVSYDLVLSIRGTDDTLTISGFFDPDYGQNMQIDAVEFADGTVWNVDKLIALASGVAGDVVLTGTAGADTLSGTADSDVLQGGTGNDLLAGGAGNDTYIFNPGDGVDRIVDSGGTTDTIQFGAGISVDSLSLGLGSLLVRVGDQGDAIHIEDFNPNDPLNSSVIEQFKFADGTVLSIADLLARGFDIQGSNGDDLLTGTAITDRITGGDGNDTLVGGKGDDLLVGGGGNDTYVFNLGDGVDTIEDVSSAMEGNLIAFGAGITQGNLVFGRDGSDLLIYVGSQGDVVRLKDFDRFGNNGSLVANTLQFADGSQASLFELTNTAPMAEVILQNQMVLEDTAYSFTIPADTFVDADSGDSLTYSAILVNGNALPSWLVFDPATRTFSGTPTNGDVGILDLAVTATDTAGAAAVASFALDIANVNDAPTITVQIPTQSATEDAAFSFTIPVDSFTDVDAGDLLTYTASLADASALPAWLSFDAVTRTFSGTPENGDVGTLNITVTATDSTGANVAETFVMDVINTNDAPMTMADAGFVGEDQTLLYSGNVLNNDSDVDVGTILSVAAPGEYVGRYGTLSIAADGGYTYSLDNGSSDVQSLSQGSTVVDQFTYNVSDGIVMVPGNLEIKVTGNNDTPVVAGDSAFLIEDMVVSASGNVLANDTDVDAGTTLTVADPATRMGSYGTLSLATDGSYVYSLDNAGSTVQSLGRGAVVAEHFSYIATDGIVSVASALDITLTGSNDAPILVAPLVDRQVNFHKDFSWHLPAGSFVDPDQGDTLSYRATLADGSALPTWLAFDAAAQAFSGQAPKQVCSVEVKVTATDKVAATGSTEGSLSTSDVFRITVSHGNEGVGNGEDAPPTGHDGNFNDGPDTGPGNPGRRRDHDDHRSSGRGGDRSDDWDNDRAWGQSQRVQPAYLNASHWDDKQSSTTSKSGEQVDPSVVFGRWLTMDLAVSKALAEKKTLSWLDERLGADTTALSKASTGFLGSTTSFGTDLFSLQAGHGQELKGFKGLGEVLRKVA